MLQPNSNFTTERSPHIRSIRPLHEVYKDNSLGLGEDRFGRNFVDGTSQKSQNLRKDRHKVFLPSIFSNISETSISRYDSPKSTIKVGSGYHESKSRQDLVSNSSIAKFNHYVVQPKSPRIRIGLENSRLLHKNNISAFNVGLSKLSLNEENNVDIKLNGKVEDLLPPRREGLSKINEEQQTLQKLPHKRILDPKENVPTLNSEGLKRTLSIQENLPVLPSPRQRASDGSSPILDILSPFKEQSKTKKKTVTFAPKLELVQGQDNLSTRDSFHKSPGIKPDVFQRHFTEPDLLGISSTSSYMLLNLFRKPKN